MAEYIEREAALNRLCQENCGRDFVEDKCHNCYTSSFITYLPAADVAPVVRCQNCIHAEPLDSNCEINTSVYMHCKIQRGEETKNVWHKYKKYYKDYSLVDRDGFCDEGARMDGE